MIVGAIASSVGEPRPRRRPRRDQRSRRGRERHTTAGILGADVVIDFSRPTPSAPAPPRDARPSRDREWDGALTLPAGRSSTRQRRSYPCSPRPAPCWCPGPRGSVGCGGSWGRADVGIVETHHHAQGGRPDRAAERMRPAIEDARGARAVHGREGVGHAAQEIGVTPRRRRHRGPRDHLRGLGERIGSPTGPRAGISSRAAPSERPGSSRAGRPGATRWPT